MADDLAPLRAARVCRRVSVFVFPRIDRPYLWLCGILAERVDLADSRLNGMVLLGVHILLFVWISRGGCVKQVETVPDAKHDVLRSFVCDDLVRVALGGSLSRTLSACCSPL